MWRFKGCVEEIVQCLLEVWNCSIMPVPVGRVKRVCDPNKFKGISLTSLVAEVMCMVPNNWLANFLEADGILADEQGGFRNACGTCRFRTYKASAFDKIYVRFCRIETSSCTLLYCLCFNSKCDIIPSYVIISISLHYI